MSFVEFMSKGGAEAKKIEEILSSWWGFQLIDINLLYERMYWKICLENLFSLEELEEMADSIKKNLKRFNKYLTVAWWFNQRLPSRTSLYSRITLSQDENPKSFDDRIDYDAWIPPLFCLKRKTFTTATNASQPDLEQRRIWLTKYLTSFTRVSPFDDGQDDPEKRRCNNYLRDHGTESNQSTNHNVDSHPHDQMNEEEEISTTESEQRGDPEFGNASPGEGARYKCQHCHKSYDHLSSLYKHYRSAHENVRYTCKYCDRFYTHLSSLKFHIKNIHEGRRHQCGSCDQSFSRQSSLLNHIKVDHDMKRYQCEFCNKSYKNRSTMIAHIKNFHAGQT